MSQKILSKNKITLHDVDPVCQKNFELLYYDHREQVTEEDAINTVLKYDNKRTTFENESCTPVRIDELTVLEHRRVTKKQQYEFCEVCTELDHTAQSRYAATEPDGEKRRKYHERRSKESRLNPGDSYWRLSLRDCFSNLKYGNIEKTRCDNHPFKQNDRAFSLIIRRLSITRTKEGNGINGMISGKENIKAFFESMKLTDDATVEAEITIHVVAPPKAEGYFREKSGYCIKWAYLKKADIKPILESFFRNDPAIFSQAKWSLDYNPRILEEIRLGLVEEFQEEIEEVREKFLVYPELRSREKIKKLQFTFSPAEYEHYYKLLQTTKFRVIPEKDGECNQQRKHYDYDPKDFEGYIDRIYEDSKYYRIINGKGRRGWIGHMGWYALVRNYITKIFLIENGEGLNLKSIAVTNDHGEIIDEKEKAKAEKRVPVGD
jgi:hypothetical protein